MFRKFALVAIAALSGSVGAHAADLPMKAMRGGVFTPSFNWTGFYVGVGGGVMSGNVTGPATTGISNADGTAAFVAVMGGYRYQTSSGFVIGIDVSAPVWAETVSITPQPTFPGSQGFDSAKPNYVILPTVQIGYAFGQWLPYVGFGVGIANIKATTSAFGPGATAPSLFTDTQTSTVYDFAVGLDYAVTYNWIVGIRYDHLILPDTAYSFNEGFTTPSVQQVGANVDVFTASAKYKF
jgi:outer membrane immunogenic protein